MNMTATISAPAADAQAPPESADALGAEVLGFHRGAIDQTTITTRLPGAVMKQVDAILFDMGVETKKEGTYKYRCIRPQKGAADPFDAPHAARVGSPDCMDSPTVSGMRKTPCARGSDANWCTRRLNSSTRRQSAAQVSDRMYFTERPQMTPWARSASPSS